jgi:pimeloyl-ACP methyl ester carboxylesterase
MLYVEATCGEYSGRSPLIDVDVPLAFVLPSPGAVLVRGYPQTFRFGVATNLVPSLPRLLKASDAFDAAVTTVDVLDEDGNDFDTITLREVLDDEPSRVDLQLNGPRNYETEVTFGQAVIDLPAGVYDFSRTLEHKSGYASFAARNKEVLVVDAGEAGLACDLVTLAAMLAWRAYGADNSYIYGKSSFDSLPGCNGPILVPVVLYAQGASHISVHATPTLAAYLRGGAHPDSLNPATSLVTISIRGTVLSSVGDWLSNLNAWTESCEEHELPCGEGDVHEGFVLEYATIRPILHRTLRLLASLNEHPPVLFAGHSQGGALATFAALEAAQALGDGHKVHLVSFGSPKVGFTAFSEAFDRLVGRGRHMRVDSTGDLIPTLPPSPYLHVGTEYVVDAGGHSMRGYLEAVAVAGSARPAGATFEKLPEREEVEAGGEESLRVAGVGGEEAESAGMSTVALAAIVATTLACCCLLVVTVAALLLARQRKRSRHSHSLSVAPPSLSPTPARPRVSRRSSRSLHARS